jgi:hypothetical protein
MTTKLKLVADMAVVTALVGSLSGCERKALANDGAWRPWEGHSAGFLRNARAGPRCPHQVLRDS